MCFEGYPHGCPSGEPGIPGPAGMLTLEEMIRKFPKEHGLWGSEYILKVTNIKDGRLHIYIRPSDRNGETLDYWLDGNVLTPLG